MENGNSLILVNTVLFATAKIVLQNMVPIFRKRIYTCDTTFYDIPIQRFICNQTGPVISQHRTFSLLPINLVPYRQHDLNFMLEAVTNNNKTDASYEDTISYINTKTDIAIEYNQVCEFNNIFEESFSKINFIPELKQIMTQSTCYDCKETISSVLNFINNYTPQVIDSQNSTSTQIEKLSYEFFYYSQTTTYFQRHFLFGTPSQKQKHF